MFENGICTLRTTELNEKNQKKSQNGFKRRWNLGENYKPRFESKSTPNIKLLKKIRIGKKKPKLTFRNLLPNALI